MTGAVFRAQIRIGKPASDAACGPRGQAERKPKKAERKQKESRKKAERKQKENNRLLRLSAGPAAARFQKTVINRHAGAYTFLNRKEVVSMPEYRRFISYFYEYIDGKKQKNTGFAKVELRNNVWRILFRLTVSALPEPPVEVFGFVRAGKEMTEEWAYRADEPVWMGKYNLSDISGIWIRSRDGRCFATVWDDEPVDPAWFAGYKPQEEDTDKEERTPEAQEKDTDRAERIPEAREKNADGAERTPGAQEEEADRVERTPEPQEKDTDRAEQTPEVQEKNAAGNGGQHADTEISARLESSEGEAGPKGSAGKEVRLSDRSGGEIVPEENAGKEIRPGGRTEEEIETEDAAGKEIRPNSRSGEEAEAEIEAEALSERNPTGETAREEEGTVPEEAPAPEPENPEDARLWNRFYKNRTPFEPFADQEISSCIRVAPGDIVVLQNARWKTGKNNFLLHGYHNYRHLLIGRRADGRYVLGVPGVMNPQEKYMAAMFGFPDFKYADNQEEDRAFGYWCRLLKKETEN